MPQSKGSRSRVVGAGDEADEEQRSVGRLQVQEESCWRLASLTLAQWYGEKEGRCDVASVVVVAEPRCKGVSGSSSRLRRSRRRQGERVVVDRWRRWEGRRTRRRSSSVGVQQQQQASRRRARQAAKARRVESRSATLERQSVPRLSGEGSTKGPNEGSERKGKEHGTGKAKASSKGEEKSQPSSPSR